MSKRRDLLPKKVTHVLRTLVKEEFCEHLVSACDELDFILIVESFLSKAKKAKSDDKKILKVLNSFRSTNDTAFRGISIKGKMNPQMEIAILKFVEKHCKIPEIKISPFKLPDFSIIEEDPSSEKFKEIRL